MEIETELEDFGDIIDALYTKYKDAIGFEIKSLDKVKKLGGINGMQESN